MGSSLPVTDSMMRDAFARDAQAFEQASGSVANKSRLDSMLFAKDRTRRYIDSYSVTLLAVIAVTAWRTGDRRLFR